MTSPGFYASLWLAAALIGHGALWVEAVNRLHGLGLPRKLVDALTGLCGLAVAGIPLYAAWRLGASDTLPAWLAGYAHASIGVLALVIAGRLALRGDPQRITGGHATATITTLDLTSDAGVVAGCHPTVRRIARLPGNQLLRVAVEERELLLARLPSGWDGMRIAHLTDLHMAGRLGVEYFRAIVDRTNAWRPDFVFITGDIVEHPPQLDWVGPVLGGLDPSVASYFILGNHDEKVDCAELRTRLEAANIADVGSEPAIVSERFPGLAITGDERPWFATVPPALPDAPLHLRLAHTPDRFAAARRDGVDLMFAGHCHGGQVCFPVLGPLLCPSRHGVRYAAGTFRADGTVMHASRGTGSLFPLRYACPPELGLFTLRSMNSSSSSA
ncbi:MAG: metallophosphoesterase [Planctomycetota bacterium]